MERADEEIKKEVVDQLYWDSRVDASGIKVMVVDGKVTLSGVVRTYTARKAAVNDTWVIPGVRLVQDRLLVRYTVEVPPDEQIERNAVNALIWNPNIDFGNIRVTVNEGLVSLEGTVDTYWKKIIVEDLLANITGVLVIRNKITVVPTESQEDERIARDVIGALGRTNLVPVGTVTVQVRSGVVTLTGAVPDSMTRLAAEEKAAHTVGVVDVQNQLVLGTGSE